MTHIRSRPDLTALRAAYDLLLLAYPKQHRRQYGDLMRQAFHDVSVERYLRHGLPGLASLSVSVLADTLLSAARERFFIAHFNPLALLNTHVRALMLIAGLTFVMSGITHLQPGIQYVYVSTYRTLQYLYMIGYLLAGLALIGASARVPGTLKHLLRVSGVLIVTCILYVVAGYIAPRNAFLESLWHIFMLAFLTHHATLLAAGIIAVCAERAWGLLCIALSVGQTIYWLSFSDRGILVGPSWPDFFIFAAIGLGWALLGATLRWAKPQNQPFENVFELM